MRVHELDEAYGLSKDDVKTVLTLAGLSTHHLSNMDDEELKSFEIALELFREDTEGEAPAEDEEELEGLLGDFESALNGEPSPLVEGELEHTPDSDVFPCVNDRGAFTENCLLPPDLAEKVRAILGKNRINSYLLDLDRGEFVFVVWEEARKYSVRISQED